jgi:hypothetical protein
MSKQLPPEEDPTSIGNILVSMGLLTEEKLAELVEDFKASKEELLGQFIVRRTELTEHQIEVAWLRQKRLRGKTNEAVVVRLMEISRTTNERIVNGADQLMMAAKVALK